MARRTLIDIDNKIISAVYKIGASQGVHAITAQKVAKMCGISHFTIFEHFQTKENLLQVAAETFDRKYMGLMEELLNENHSRRTTFQEMIKLFVKDADGALYYNNYTLERGFDPTQANKRSEEFLKYAKSFFYDKNYADSKYLLMWDYVTSMSFYYAEKIIHGYIPNTQGALDLITDMITEGIGK